MTKNNLVVLRDDVAGLQKMYRLILDEESSQVVKAMCKTGFDLCELQLKAIDDLADAMDANKNSVGIMWQKIRDSIGSLSSHMIELLKLLNEIKIE